MPHNMSKLLLMLLAVPAALSTSASDFSYTYKGQTLTYTVLNENAKTASVSRSPNRDISGKLIIPEIVKDGNTAYTVVSIGD